MHKARKNSLSPCYSTSTNNKENLPIQNLTSPIGISFRNLEGARRKKTLDSNCTQNVKMSLNNYLFQQSSTVDCQKEHRKLKKNEQSESSRRESEKSIDDYRSSLKSKQKQMSSLHSQVNTLNSTISLLKQQLSSIKQQNKQLQNGSDDYKKIIRQKDQMIQKLRRQKIERTFHEDSRIKIRKWDQFSEISHSTKEKMNVSQYEEVNQKLNELEVIQNKLLEENQNLKKKQMMHKAMFKNIRILLNANRLKEIEGLLAVLNQ